MGKRYAKKYLNNNIYTSIYNANTPSFGARLSHNGGVVYISPSLKVNIQYVKNVLISAGYTGTFSSSPAAANYWIVPGTTIRAMFSNGAPSITWKF